MNVVATSKDNLMPISRKVMNLAHFLTQAAQRTPASVGLVWGALELSWAQIHARVDAMASALSAMGIRKGDRILVHSPNCNQMFETMFVCFRLGAVWVPTNFRQTSDDVTFLAGLTGARVFICHADFTAHASAVSAADNKVERVISIGGSAFGEDYDTLVEHHRDMPVENSPVEYDDPCWFFLTSGTTGKPKAAVLTHGQMAFVVNNHLCDLMPGSYGETDASLVVAPLSHGAGIHQLVQTARGIKTVLLSGAKFDAEEAWRLVETWRVTNMFTVPTILKMLVEHAAVDRLDHGSLRYVIYAGAPMYRKDQQYALAKLGKVLVQYFGLGEVTGNITVLPPALHSAEDGPDVRLNTCGLARTGMQIAIQDESGKALAPFETGEIAVCGPAVFAGYFNNPEANAKSFRNGWFLTGDLGYVDREGFLFITGRASDMYISGGSNVYPREIEEKLLMHPALSEAVVFGVPDDVWGEVGVAVCVTRDGMDTDETKLKEWLSGRIANYKQLRRIGLWDAIPKTAYGKISKKEIRAQWMTMEGPTKAGAIQPDLEKSS
ncbi:acyl-CoA synthetase [Rhizobium sp.]